MDKESFAYKLMYFCKDTLEAPFPEEEFSDGETVSSEWLSWIDECYEAFCNKKWRNNKSLLNNMLEDK